MKIVFQDSIAHHKVKIGRTWELFRLYLFLLTTLIVFHLIFGLHPSADATVLVSASICLITMTDTLYGIGLTLTALRENNIFKQIAATPKQLWKVVFVLCLSHVMKTALVSTLLVVAVSFVRGTAPTDVIATSLVFVIGVIMFVALALAVASLVRSMQQAVFVTQTVFAAMFFLGGLPVPFEAMTGFQQKLALPFPSAWYTNALRKALFGVISTDIHSVDRWWGILIPLLFSLTAGWVVVKSSHRE